MSSPFLVGSLLVSLAALPGCGDSSATDPAPGSPGVGGSSSQAGNGGTSTAGTSGGGATGGTSGGGKSAGGSGGAATGTGGAAAGAPGAGGGSTAGAGGTASAGSTGVGGAGGSGGAAGCPSDLSGAYTVTDVGLGCGDLATSAKQCVVLPQQVCSFLLTSGDPNGPQAVNGVVMLGPDGTFSDAALKFGTVQRTGCIGSWDAASKTLTATCGGTDPGSTQYCSAKLVKSGAACM